MLTPQFSAEARKLVGQICFFCFFFGSTVSYLQHVKSSSLTTDCTWAPLN